MRLFYVIILLLLTIPMLPAQMHDGGKLRYGNEWINTDQRYYSFSIAADGVYRISFAQMQSSGIPIDDIDISGLQLWQNGKQVPILIGDDFIEFIGYKNRIALDSFLTAGGKEDLLNHEYGLINDTSYYYLSWQSDSTTNARIQAHDPDLGSANPSTPFIWTQDEIVFTEEWTKPYTKISGANIYLSSFERGEGFASPLMQKYSAAFDLKDPYLDGPNGSLSLRFTGDYDPHDFSFRLNGTEVYRQSAPSFAMRIIETDLSPATMSNAFEFTLEGMLDARDRFQIAHITANYPAHPFLPGNGKLWGSVDEGTPTIEINTADDRQWYYYDLSEGHRYAFVAEGGRQKTFASESLSGHEFLWCASDQIQAIEELQEVRFRQWDAVLASDYIILTSRRLHQEEAQNPVEAYADFRASEQGGEYATAIVDVEDIYQSFGYGIQRHPQSIRNFAHYLKANNPNHPSVFIIGKGREYSYTRTPEELADPSQDSYFVPTFGYPSSDNLLFADSGQSAPMFPLGRLSIESKAEITEYLNKVQVQEAPVGVPTYENSYWRKKVLHLSGGGSLSPLISTFMDNMEQSLNANIWRPEVNTFNKTSNQAIERTVTDQIYDKINEGVGLVTFFGHSATNALDFDINIPEKYENYGRFPFLIALGCNSGNINTPQQSVGEIYSSFDHGGFIGSVATSGPGEVTQLYLYASDLYQQLSQNVHAETIGAIIRRSLLNRQSSDIRHSQQITLHGDPALRIIKTSGTDYTFDLSSFATNPERIEVNQDSIEVSIDILNLGIKPSDSVKIQLEHLFGGEERTYSKIFPKTVNRQTARFKIGLGRESKNVNQVKLTIDPEDKIDETPTPVAEENNSTSGLLNEDLSFYVFSNGTNLDWPYEFAIVDSFPLKIQFTTSDALTPINTYFLEISTHHQFNSIIYTTELQESGGVIEHTLPLELDSGQVYYWRIGFETEQGEMEWEQSSFIFLPGKKGWNQSDDGQYLSNPSCDFIFHRDTLFFEKEYIYAEIKNTYKGNGLGFPGILYNGVDFASVRQAFQLVDEGVGITVFDTLNNFFQPNRNGDYGSVNSGGSVVHSYVYKTNNANEREKAVNFLENHIPEHSYVYFYTIVNDALRGDSLQLEEWPKDTAVYNNSLVNTLEQLGAKQIKTAIEDDLHLYIYVFKKGDGYLNEGASNEEIDFLKVGTTLTRRIRNGGLSTSNISIPKSAIINYQTEKWNPEDRNRIYINQIDRDGNLLQTSLQDSTAFNAPVSSLFQSDSVRNIQFDLDFSDSSSVRTAPQLKHLRVFYEYLPDLTWTPKVHFEVSHDTIEIGDSLELSAGFKDIMGRLDQNQINVSLEVLQGSKVISTQQMKGIFDNGFYRLDHQLSTVDWAKGYTNLRLRIDPENAIQESNEGNNLLNIELYVQEDQLTPELKVFIDGRVPEDMSPVSLQPLIKIELTDFMANNKLEQKHLEFTLIEPNTDSFQFDSQRDKIRWYSSINDSFAQLHLQIQPKLQQLGTYRLEVQGSDFSGNETAPYSIHFVVPDQGKLEDVRLLPNPTRGNMRIQYSLRDNKKLKDFKLFLYNSEGKRVRSYTVDQIGPLKVGESMQTDTISLHGSSSLPPGVYYYELTTSLLQTEGKIIILD